MADLKSCETCSYVGKNENDYPCSKCIMNASDMWKPMSNADKIRAMDDEELAELFAKLAWNSEVQTTPLKYLEWLQSEAE